jgi:Glyoxalase/Bleomycin resistance protein/Dioxygenase superfamily.
VKASGDEARSIIVRGPFPGSMAQDPEEPPMLEPLAGLPPTIHRVGRIHHVAVIVREMNAALGFYRDILGLAPGPVVPIPVDRVNIAFLPVGEVRIELVEPTDTTTGVARFLIDPRPITSASRSRTSQRP